jgi:hypothetical protein
MLPDGALSSTQSRWLLALAVITIAFLGCNFDISLKPGSLLSVTSTDLVLDWVTCLTLPFSGVLAFCFGILASFRALFFD